jgi:hypothetical protein
MDISGEFLAAARTAGQSPLSATILDEIRASCWWCTCRIAAAEQERGYLRVAPRP